MTRFKIKIGRDTVLALNEVENMLQKDSGKKVTRGDAVVYSWSLIEPKKNSIDWLKISNEDISNIISTIDNSVVGINTTLNIDEDVLNSLKDFQYSLAKDFGQLIYFPYALKLVLVATILENRGIINEYIK